MPKGHVHDHGHSHGTHSHHHTPADFGRAFAIGVALNLAYVVLEALFGVLSGSLALIADAGHNLSDVLGLALAWAAAALARRPPSGRHTYGFKRTPILASLANAVILLVAVGIIAWEAIHRLFQPEPIAAWTMIWVALVGVAVNGTTAWLFMAGRHGDLNIRGAFLHMAADTAVTVGVIIAALLIRWTGWLWLDPAVSLLIALVILAGTWGLLRDSMALAVDAVPPGIDLDAVRSFLASPACVEEVHDLHVWGMSTTESALTAHLVCTDRAQADALLELLPRELHERFGIDHATVQIETPGMARNCGLRSEQTV
jgi:cobalt-zinc-cadmium efflux system protein